VTRGGGSRSRPRARRVSTNTTTVPSRRRSSTRLPRRRARASGGRGKGTPGARATEWRASIYAKVFLTFGGEPGVPLFTRDVLLAVPLLGVEPRAIDWKLASRLDPAAFAPRAPQGFHLFDPVPEGLVKSSGLPLLRQGAEDEARARFGHSRLEDRARGIFQREGESRAAFLARVQGQARDDRRASGEAVREAVRERLRRELDAIRQELGLPLPVRSAHALATLVLGPHSPLHFASAWARRERRRGVDAAARGRGAAAPRARRPRAREGGVRAPRSRLAGLTSRVLAPRDARVDAVGLV